MKAIGIVRRIDEAVIIGPSQRNPVKSWSFADLVLYILKFRGKCQHRPKRKTKTEKPRIALFLKVCYNIKNAKWGWEMNTANIIKELRQQTGMNRREFSEYTKIPVRTLEDWEAGKRTPPEYIPRLLNYQLLYDKWIKENEVQGDEL